MNPYIGNESQLYGVEESVLAGGYKDGVRMLRVYNAAGLEMQISLDRNADIVSLKYQGKNLSYITPNGIRHHMNYEPAGDGWIRHFTAGFLTTCGYQNVGSPCTVDGTDYPLHGSINYIPVDHYSYEADEDGIVVRCVVLDESIFSRKIKRTRTFRIAMNSGQFSIEDEFVNRGGEISPLSILYHMNLGYPLLKEDTIVRIAHDHVEPRNAYSGEYLSTACVMEKPTPGFQERVYFYTKEDDKGLAEVISPSENLSLSIAYDAKKLPFLSEWKMMGVRDYVLGIEPGNVTPEGYAINREKGRIVTLKPGDTLRYDLHITVK